MITETEVVHAVRLYLKAQGWTVDDYSLPNQTGDDVVATRGDEELRIEAKGEGSEKPHSRRCGKPFTRDQVKSHVAAAFYRAARMRSRTVRAGMAFPDNEYHREMVSAIEASVRELRIAVFWVSETGSVTHYPFSR